MKKLIVLFAMLAGTAIMFAQEQKLQPTVTVTGEGIVSLVPDGVTITVSVENDGKSAEEVKTLNDTSLDATLKFLKKMKLDAKNYKTEYIRLTKNYDYNTKEYKYTASQNLIIQLKDLSKYEELMQGLLSNGVNRIDGVNFTSTKTEAAKIDARKKAVENAKQKAMEYAGVLGQQIGKAIQISEESTGYTPVPVYAKAMAFNDSAEIETIAVGEMEVSAKITIVFELK